ncbi:MAG TPA: tetratricopeptide repeat protein [Gemmatimonadota bacterium]|nr:tetratricopeptide repeat protein [Gemmatimonadota bacterium]
MIATTPRRLPPAFLPLLLITGGCALVFANTLHNGFHLDDHYRILDNPEIRHVQPIGRHFLDPSTISGTRGISESRLHQLAQYRPLLPLSLSLNYAIGGYDVTGYHVVNVVLHGIAALLVYLLLLEALRARAPARRTAFREARDPRPIALFSALTFALHPVSGIPVNYILARDLLLMQVFLTGSLLQYLRMRRRGWSPAGWAGCLALLVLALMSKSTAAAVPLVVLVFEGTLGRERWCSVLPWRRSAPFALAVVAFYAGVARLLDFSELARVQTQGAVLWRYPLTQARVHVEHYLSNFVWPFPIRMAAWVDPAQGLLEPGVLGGLAVAALSLGFAWRVRRRMPAVAFGILAYSALMLPESSIVPLHHAAVHYRPYPASPFLFLAVAAFLIQILGPRRAMAVGCVAIAWFASNSVVLNRTWRTDETLWAHSVRHGAEPLGHMNFAMSLSDRRDPRVRQHLEEALRGSPNYILAHVNLGLLDLDEGRLEEGITRLERAAMLDPGQAEPHYWLAIAYTRLGRDAEAALASGRAAGIDPKNLRYLYKAGVDASAIGDHRAALELARRVTAIDPEFAETGFLEAYSLQMLGRLDEAIPVYRAFLESHPDHAQVRFNLGHAFMSIGNCEAAIPQLARSIELAPNPSASTYLERCRGELEEIHVATRTAARAVEGS